MMPALSDDLSDLGYEPTGRESPFDEDGYLWTMGHELVCDETGIVISKDNRRDPQKDDDSRRVYRYRHSGRVKMPGGYVSSYDWGRDEDSRFKY